MSTPIHIVMVTRVLPHHSIGGMQAVAWDLATEFVRRGVTVTILTATIPGMPEQFRDAGVNIRALRGTTWQRYGKHWWRETRRVFERELLSTCSLVFSISAGGFSLLPLRSRMPQIPFVLQAHGTSVGELISKWKSGSLRGILTSSRNAVWIARDLAAYPKFDAIVSVGRRVSEDFEIWPVRQFVDKARLRLIPNGIDTRVFFPNPTARIRLRSELGWSRDLRIVVSASRLHKQKGIDLGLKAFAQLARTTGNMRYLIIGDGPESQALKRMTEQMSLGGLVRFTGGLSRETMADYLNAADAMLFTTRRVEGNPLNILEALAVGLPVIASSHLRQTVPPSKAIVLVNERDAAEVSSALHGTFSREAPRESLLPQELSMIESARAHLALFDELIARRH